VPLLQSLRYKLIYNGNPALIRNTRYGNPVPGSIKHNICQWDIVFDNHDLFKGGWAGQGLLVNPDRNLVAVWSGFMNDAGRSTPLMPVLRGMLDTLYPGTDPESPAEK